MIILFTPLLLIALIGGTIYTLGRSHRAAQPTLSLGPAGDRRDASPASLAGRGAPGQGLASTPPQSPLRQALARWIAAGIISPDQATSIEAHEQLAAEQAAVAMHEARTQPRRVPLVAEALGYLGGTLGIVGLVLLVSRYWPDMPTATRLGLSGGGAAALAAAGYAVHEQTDAALTRLRWFLWTLSTPAAALFAGVLAADAFGAEYAGTIALTVAGVVAVQNAVLWSWRVRPIQQLLCLAALVVTAATAVDQVAAMDAVGAMVWVLGAVLVVLAIRQVTPISSLTAGLGAASMIVGAGLTVEQWHGAGMLAAALTTVGVLALAAVPGVVAPPADRTVLVVIGGVGGFQVIPATIAYFAQHAGRVAGLVVWAAGGLLVLVAARRLVRAPIAVEITGSIAVLVGAAVTGAQSAAFATIFGLITAVGLIVLGSAPGRVLLSLFGSLGLLVNVPWAISHFFPGEGRAPLLILASGAVIVAVAVWLARMGGRLRSELRR
jgi:hypothetical protein